MPVVVPAPGDICLFSQISPGCFQRCDWSRRIIRARPPEREDVPLGPEFAKTENVPIRVRRQCVIDCRIQWDRSSFTGLGLTAADSKVALLQVELAPSQRLNFRIAHAGVKS